MTQVPLSVADAAPDFTLQDQHGRDVTLSEFAGHKAVLLVFYPFAFSGVCTGELVGLRDRLGDFETDESTLVAISCDPLYAQRALADRDAIFFPLLSDFWPHGAVASAYGAFDESSGGARRSSYLIDKTGVVRWSVHNPKSQPRDLDAHAEAVRCLLDEGRVPS
jgi:peroxiredoxin